MNRSRHLNLYLQTIYHGRDPFYYFLVSHVNDNPFIAERVLSGPYSLNAIDGHQFRMTFSLRGPGWRKLLSRTGRHRRLFTIPGFEARTLKLSFAHGSTSLRMIVATDIQNCNREKPGNPSKSRASRFQLDRHST
ncbi:MAG: hypothetical protein M3Z09_10085 [Acidobacteriota bacterium]|nr:hypothetical protein [Acidobacteriota bacterium]